MAMKTRMMKHFKESIKNKLIKNKQCEYCELQFSSSNEYLCHISIHPNEIIPNLFIGTKDNAKDIKLMNKIGITHILYISYISNNDNLNNSLHFVANKKINIITDQNITKYFNESFIFIDYVLNDNYNKYKIMIFCEFGISLSPSFIIGYLMSRYHLSLITSLNIIKSKRNIINISKYMQQLQQYQDRYCYINNNNQYQKKTQIVTTNKINISNNNNNKKEKEKESFIEKRVITMKSNVYEEKLLNNNYNHTTYTHHNLKQQRIGKSYSSGYLPLDSHILFTNI